MREIGGYIELDRYHLPMLHEGALALNCGRNALAYLLHARKIKRLWIPRLMCDSVWKVCEREGVPYSFYRIGIDFRPAEDIQPGENEWIYFVNYYSRFTNEMLLPYVRQYGHVIVDNAQSYFQRPLDGTDTLYTCRKYFGVADGAFLYTDARLEKPLAVSESFERMRFLLGRLERSASEFYPDYVRNNDFFENEPILLMSKLTDNLLRGIDYDFVRKKREENYGTLQCELDSVNLLPESATVGTFMYPLYVDNGPTIRWKLQQTGIYIPTLWADTYKVCEEGATEYRMAENILPLPIDQRYGQDDMKYMAETVKAFL